MGRGGAGVCLVLLLISITHGGCKDRRAAKVALVGSSSVRIEGDARIPEVEPGGVVTLRFRGPARRVHLVQGDLQRTLTATRTRAAETEIFSSYIVEGVAEGPAELRVDGLRLPVDVVTAPASELVGYRALVQTDRGVVGELDEEAPPSFRIRGEARKNLEPAFVAGDRTYPLSITRTERRGEWTIVWTAPPEGIRPGPGEVRLLDRAWPAIWVARPAPPDLSDLEEHLESGDDAAFRAAVDRRLATLDPSGRFELLAQVARLVRTRGDSDAVAAAYLEAAEAAEAAGRLTDVTRMWRAAAYAHLYARRFAQVGPLLDRAEAVDRRLDHASGLVRAAHYRGVMLTKQGRLRAARSILTEGLELASQHGLDDDAAHLKLSLATLLAELGQHREALQLHRQVAETSVVRSELDRIAQLIHLAWAELRAMEAGAVPARYEQPRHRLEAALRRARAAKAPAKAVNALANLLWLAFLKDDQPAAETLLDELAQHPHIDDSYARLFVPFARAQVRLRQGRFEAAERAFRALLRLAEREASQSDYLWRATYGLGQARRGLGDRRAARTLFERALAELNRLARQTDLTRSRALFVQDRRRLYDDAAELALETGRPLDALLLTDRARTHVLRALEAQVRTDRLAPKAQRTWQARAAEYLSLRSAYERRSREAELTDPAEAEAFEAETRRMRDRLKALFDAAYGYLDSVSPPEDRTEITPERIFDALGDGVGLITFAGVHQRTDSFFVTRGVVEHRRDAAGISDTWSHRLEGLHHLYVVAGGQVGVEDVLDELAARPDLLRQTSVSFLSHVAALSTDTPSPHGPSVVVGDPDGTLPFARREGAWVAEQWAVELRTGAVTRAQVLEGLDGASAFHFAGHGVLTAAQPWDAHLLLGRGETLSLEDLLIARPKVGLVVLSGCETGRASPLSRTEAIGLPHAFTLAGAGAVLATTKEVADEGALRFVKRFYEAGGRSSPVTGYQKVALASLDEGDDTWRSFFVLGRKR